MFHFRPPNPKTSFSQARRLQNLRTSLQIPFGEALHRRHRHGRWTAHRFRRCNRLNRWLRLRGVGDGIGGRGWRRGPFCWGAPWLVGERELKNQHIFDGFFRIWKISSFFNSTSTHLISWMFQTGHVSFRGGKMLMEPTLRPTTDFGCKKNRPIMGWTTNRYQPISTGATARFFLCHLNRIPKEKSADEVARWKVSF